MIENFKMRLKNIYFLYNKKKDIFTVLFAIGTPFTVIRYFIFSYTLLKLPVHTFYTLVHTIYTLFALKYIKIYEFL